jgi:hypothetical protein
MIVIEHNKKKQFIKNLLLKLKKIAKITITIAVILLALYLAIIMSFFILILLAIFVIFCYFKFFFKNSK